MNDAAAKFQNYIVDLNFDTINAYINLINQYGEAIFVHGIVDCKTRKYTLQERYRGFGTIPTRVSQYRITEMNNNVPFNYFFIDTMQKKLFKAEVIHCYRTKNEIPEQDLNTLIPKEIQSFYAYAYYRIRSIEEYDYEVAKSIVNVNTHAVIYDALQINPNAPWRVEMLEGAFAEYIKQNTIIKNASTTPLFLNPGYCVYRFYIPLNETTTLSYIGMTGDINTRYQHHANPASWRSKAESEKYLYMAFKNANSGFDKFKFEILHDNLTEEEAHYYEALEIQNYNAYYPFGFNVRDESKYLNTI